MNAQILSAHKKMYKIITRKIFGSDLFFYRLGLVHTTRRDFKARGSKSIKV